ncbi:hypothetical protein pmac_cds_661 [Pandoravirus macleodensis]|uniref:DUF5900 domain-containing protein n=1 Tax=Pandoravirus macleodensis TaxID=2107707 RepID=A0A2U7UFS7_9VIRU|nr:hypothetical protein pmac_cds_661 [Pandoravirus macleodensis]AVK77349.1 hypothetical protein pmac_cds_661 [Pandoravirus macleodensis]
MRMRRRSDLGDRAPLVKDMPTTDGDDREAHAPHARGRTWYARLRQCWRRLPAGARRQAIDTVQRGEHTHRHKQDIDVVVRGGCGALDKGDHTADAAYAMHADSWRRAYAVVYGVDRESGDPMDHAVLRRIGASWRFMWTCRQPIADIPTIPGAIVHGELALPNGDLVRGAFCVCRLPLASEQDTPVPSGPTLSCDRVICPIDTSMHLATGRSRAGPPKVGDGGNNHTIYDNNNDDDIDDDDDDDDDDTADSAQKVSYRADNENNATIDDTDEHGNVGGYDGSGATRDSSTSPRLLVQDNCPDPSDPHDKAFLAVDNTTTVDQGDDTKQNRPDTKAALALVPHGHAAAIGVDGSLIEGSFCMGLLHGHGRTVDARGEIFGQWRHGRLHGRAVAVTQDGWFVCATWRDGRLMGDYFAHAAHGEQFRCKTCPDGRFDGRCRRGYPGGDWAIERWSNGTLVGIDGFRIAPVADSDDLAEGAVLDDCEWTCDRVRGGDAGVRYDGHIYYPSDPATQAFALFYDYMASEASARAFTEQQRDAFVWAMWMARRRRAAGLPA